MGDSLRPHTDIQRGGKRVHRSLENFDEYNIEPPLLTSPRSLEACLRQGLQPEELVFRYFDSFQEQGAASDLQEIRWKHYEKKRLEKLAQAREERQQLVQAGWQPRPHSREATADTSKLGLSMNTSDGGEQSSAALKEQRAIESMKARRAQELQQMVAYELKLQSVAEEQQRAQEIERQKDLQRQREAQKRQKAWEEMQRAKEVQKAKDEVRQEKFRRKMAAEEFEREQERKRQEELEEKERMRRARQREIEAAELREERKRQTLAILEAQQEVIEERRRRMAEKDEIRKAEMQKKQLEMMVQAEEQRARATTRIIGALDQKKQILRDQRERFDERQARNAEKRAQYEKQQQQEVERRRQVAQDKRDELKRAFRKMELIEEKKKKDTIDKERQQEANLAKLRAVTSVQNKQQAERNALKQADKKESVERLHRIQEYERQLAVQRLQDDDVRTTALADFKAKMLEERKAFKRQNDMERYRVIQSMEKMRKNPASAVKGMVPEKTA